MKIGALVEFILSKEINILVLVGTLGACHAINIKVAVERKRSCWASPDMSLALKKKRYQKILK